MSHLPYRCSLKYFWAGVKDSWVEKVSGQALADSSQADSSKASPVGTALTLFLIFSGVALALATFLPAFAASGFAPAPSTIFAGAHALFVLTVLGTLAYLARKVLSFTKKMCVRGWELEVGIRKPAKLPR